MAALRIGRRAPRRGADVDAVSATLLASIAAGAGGLAGGAAVGYWLGQRYRSDRWRLWAVYACALLACSVLCAVGLTYGQRWFAVGALGLLGGLLTGTKYGARGGFLPAGND